MSGHRLALSGLMLLTLALSRSFAAALQNAEPIHLPIRIAQSNPVAVIGVGAQQVEVIVDTGGGGIDLTEDVIRKTGGIRLKKARQGTDAYGRKLSDAPMFRVPLITIGGQAFRDVEVAQAEPNEDGGPAVANSIGRYFLRNYLVIFDYAGSSLTLWPANKNPANAGCGNTRVPMERTKSSPLAVSKFSTAAGPLRLVWDTGATWSFLAETFVRDRRIETFKRGQTPFHLAKEFSAAGTNFGSLEFVVLPVQPPEGAQGFLGANFFADHVVCMDYRKREVRVR